MKQSKTLRRISVAIVAVLLITMSVFSVTLAKYTSAKSGSLGATPATWVVTMEDDNKSTEKTLGDNFVLTPSANDVIQPGMDEIVYKIKLTNASNVKASYVVTVDTTNASKPTNMVITTTNNLTGTLDEGDTTAQTVTIEIKLNWAYETNLTDGGITAGDNVDMADVGIAFSIPVTVTMTQVNPNPSQEG